LVIKTLKQDIIRRKFCFDNQHFKILVIQVEIGLPATARLDVNGIYDEIKVLRSKISTAKTVRFGVIVEMLCE
jgi:hypothetical protein